MRPVENETVFVRTICAIVLHKMLEHQVGEARVLRRTLVYDEFDYTLVDARGFGTARVADEGITWCCPEHLDAFKVAVAL